MSVFSKVGDYANGTIIDVDEWNAELSNVYDTFNGESIDKEIHHKLNHATAPGIIVDQISAGLITDLRKSSNPLFTIGNDGKISNSTSRNKRVFNWFINSSAEQLNRLLIIPSGVNIKLLTFGGLFRTGSITSSQTVYTINKLGGFSLSSNLVFNSGIVAEQLVTVPIFTASQSASPGDIIFIERLGSAFGTDANYTLFVEWEQGLG
jgi:hypothetical protein